MRPTTGAPSNQYNNFYFGNATGNRLYMNSWYNNDLVYTGSVLTNSVVGTTYDGTTHVIRVNGRAVASRTVTTARSSVSENTVMLRPCPRGRRLVAGSLTGGAAYLNGDLRCIGISTDGLTAAQAAIWESALTAVPTGLSSGLATPLLYDETSADDANGVMTTVDGTKLARWRDGNGIGPLLI